MSSIPDTTGKLLGDGDHEPPTIHDRSPAFIPFTIADNPYLLPLVIGVTGHRDPICGDSDALQNSVRNSLREIKGKCPHTPLIVLSSLAEGADRLVARIACKEFGAILVAPLPMPQEAYEQDFSDEVSRQEFRELLDQAGRVVTLPFLTGTTLTNVAEPARRDSQYQAVGKYIARHCHILIALWDGLNTSEVGGTWQVVQFQLLGDSQQGLGPLDPPKRGPVYQIVTPRKKATNTEGIPYQRTDCYPPPIADGPTWSNSHTAPKESQMVYEAILDRVDMFNRDVAIVLPRSQRKSHANVASSTACVWVSPQDAAALPASSRSILSRFEATDLLAVHYGNWTRYTFRGLFILAFLAVCVFEICAHLFIPETTGASIASSVGLSHQFLKQTFILYPALWGLAACLWLNAKFKSYKDKFQDYRALAEALRIQFCWHLVGLPDAVEDSYLRKQRGELEWIRYALRTWMWISNCGHEAANHQIHREHLPSIQSLWIEGQRDYFATASPKEHRNASYLHAVGLITFFVGIFIALRLSLFINTTSDQEIDFTLVAIGVITVFAATLVAFAEKMAFAEHALQYHTMGVLFGYAAQRFDESVSTDEGCVAFLRELGKDALSENGDWLLMHRERRLELPIP